MRYLNILYCNLLIQRDTFLSYSSFSIIHINHLFLYNIFNADFIRISDLFCEIFLP
jgi:hypothetical protein